MSPELRRRSALALFVALALATLFGLPSLPAVDPLMSWRLAMEGGEWLALAVYLASASAALWLALHPVWPDRWPGWAVTLGGLAVLLASGLWLTSLSTSAVGDARLLCWLISLPLWSALAGLLQRSNRSTSADQPTFGPEGIERREDFAAVYHVHMARRRDAMDHSSWPYGGMSGHDDVVALSHTAYEGHRA